MGGTVKGPGTSQNQSDDKRTWLERKDNGNTPGYGATHQKRGNAPIATVLDLRAKCLSLCKSCTRHSACDTSILEQHCRSSLTICSLQKRMAKPCKILWMVELEAKSQLSDTQACSLPLLTVMGLHCNKHNRVLLIMVSRSNGL